MEQAASLVVRELTRGMEQAQELKARMGLEVSDKNEGILLEGVLSSYENALSILKWHGLIVEQSIIATTNMPESPLSISDSPRSDIRDFSRKRKKMPTWTEQVKVKSQKGVEGSPENGYSWRKYGQKVILGAIYPRSYYRCTYRDTQGCCASKQVQQNDKDPSIFDVTYKGKHTCTRTPRSKPATSSSPVKQQQNTQHYIPITEYNQQCEVTLNFPTGLMVDIENLEYQQLGQDDTGIGFEDYDFMSSVFNDNNFMSNYGEGGVHHGQQCESDITEIISAATSVSNSPIIGIDFPVGQWEFNPCFPFDDLTFLPSFSQAKE